MRGFMSTPFNRHLELDFGETQRRMLNPYQIKSEIETVCEGEIELIGTSRSKCTIKTKNSEQSEECLKITSLCDKSCTVRLHPRLNVSVGLVYLRSFDISDMDQFRDYLNEQDNENRVEKVERANFIKTGEGTSAYLVTFIGERLPYTIYLPGEPADTVVREFKSKPMLCRKCLTYGHSTGKCKKPVPVCQRCTEEGHNRNECKSTAIKCKYCSEENNHMTGAKECPVQMKEQKIVDIVQRERVTFQRARQMVEHVPSNRPIRPPSQIFPKRFEIKLLGGHTLRGTMPWTIEKGLVEHLGRKPVYLRSKPNEENTLIVEIATKNDAIKMRELEKLGDIPVEVGTSDSRNPEKGLIYIQGYDLLNYEPYTESLRKQHNLAKVEMASWIKTKNSNTRALLLSFKGETEMPEFIDIPGESARTRVYEYKRMPTLCGKCLEFGHPAKVCRGQERCTKCAAEDHKAESCESEIKCYHCQTRHVTGDKKLCQEYLDEAETLHIQTQSQISRAQAKVIFGQRKAEAAGLNYAGAARKPAASNQIKQPDLEKERTQTIVPKKPQNTGTSIQKPNHDQDPFGWKTVPVKPSTSKRRDNPPPATQPPLPSSPNPTETNEKSDDDDARTDVEEYYDSLQKKRAHSSGEADNGEQKSRRLDDGPQSQTHISREARYRSVCRTEDQRKDPQRERSKYDVERSQTNEGKKPEEKKSRQQTLNQRESKDEKKGKQEKQGKSPQSDYEKMLTPPSKSKRKNHSDKRGSNRP